MQKEHYEHIFLVYILVKNIAGNFIYNVRIRVIKKSPMQQK